MDPDLETFKSHLVVEPVKTNSPPSAPPADLPSIPTTSPNFSARATPTPKPTTPQKKISPFVPLSIFSFVLIFATIITTYLVATEQILLTNSSLQNSISQFVFQIPFIPKSSNYLIKNTLTAHQKILRNSFKGNEIISTSLGQQTLNVTGYADYSDTSSQKLFLNIDGQDLVIPFPVLNKQFFPGSKVIPEIIDGVTTYRLKFSLTPTQLNNLYPTQKISDSAKDVTVTAWINEDTNYLNQILISYTQINSTTPDAAIALTLKLFDYGKEK